MENHYPQLDELIPRLQDDDYLVRAESAWALGIIGDSAAVAALITALGDARSEVRQQAAAALGKCRAAQALRPLITALADESKYVRAQAAQALAALRASDAIPALRALLNDGDMLNDPQRAGDLHDRTVGQVAAAMIDLLEDNARQTVEPQASDESPARSLVVVSHAPSDGASYARRVVHSLREEGFEVWWAEDVPPGTDRDEAVRTAIDRAITVIVIFTEGALRSRYVKGEWTYAIRRNLVVIPYLTPGVDPDSLPLVLHSVEPVDARVDNKQAEAHILESLSKILLRLLPE